MASAATRVSANLSVTVASGDALDVRQFEVREALSSLFSVVLTVVSDNPEIDFDAVIGQDASFTAELRGRKRTLHGIANELHQLKVEEAGQSTYHLEIVPKLWLTTQRRNHRMYQRESEIDIVKKLLGEWGVEHEERLTGSYKKRKYRVQYGETDFDFLSRMLEDAGVTYSFETKGEKTTMVLSDAPQKNEARTPALRFHDEPASTDVDWISSVRLGRRIRAGKVTLRDHDYRRPPAFNLHGVGTGRENVGIEDRLERFHYTPGAFLFEADRGDATPHADDKGKYRTDEGEGTSMAQRWLDAERAEARPLSFETNAVDLQPGSVMEISGHPRGDLGGGKRFLVVESMLSGSSEDEWSHACEARDAAHPYRPAHVTPKPVTRGVESATVVGPPGEEIHTDEFGRVRVHFHWDRESKMNDDSSCWIHVSQPWGGAGFGGSNLPRIGQEVIVDFIGGDPDRPLVVGRVYTNLQKTPYKLPDHKTKSGWKSNSTGNTGGFNEIMFEDAGGSELFRMQAEKDLHKLVKNDEHQTVNRDRVRHVKRNEDITVGKNLTKQVVGNEREVTGGNRSISVGGNRSTQIGGTDSTIIGSSYALSVSPPGEGASDSTTNYIEHDKIVLSTPGGASITLQGNTITLKAANIWALADTNLGVSSAGEATFGGLRKAVLGSGSGNAVVTGRAGVDVTSAGGTVNITGGPMVMVNPAGSLFAGRVTDTAPDQITKGAATVLIGGPQFPFEVRKLPDGRIQVGNNIFIYPDPARPNFQAEVLASMGVMSTTPSGAQLLNNINGVSGHQMNIRYFTEQNGITNFYDGASDPSRGSNADIQWNPDYRSGNPLGEAAPNDSTLFHEMNHGDHAMHGRIDQTPTGDNWDNVEERTTINDGHPSENDYLAERGYPYARPDHRPNSMVPGDQRPGPGSHP
ncbi:MAG: type VI secretion system tip protein TssI/VgrG [Minicystis sp.]